MKLEMINGFNYSRYLREKKILGIVDLENFEILKKEKDFNYYLFKFKEKLLNKLDREYTENSGFLKAILLGETSSLDEEIKENFKTANISHVLAISGMHISYIVLWLENILKIFIKSIKKREAILIIFLNIFAIFVGGSNSVWRACIMTSIVYIGRILLRKEDFFTSFKIALIILLFANPYNIFSGAMWLSFGGSIGIVLYSKLLEKLILKKIDKFYKVKLKKSTLEYTKLPKLSKLKLIIIKELVITTSVAVGAQIVVLPIMIYIFNTISLNFIISNILISKLVGPIIIFGYLSLIFPFFSIIENILIKIIFLFAKVCANLPFNNILVPTPSLLNIIIYYLILVIIIYFYNNKKLTLARKVKKAKFKVIMVSLIIFILLFSNFKIPFKKDFEIQFLDVGQGDCSLITTAENKNILIDGGKGIGDEYDYGENVIAPYLLDHGIISVDYIIVSHFDSDHVGGLFYIIEKFKVKNIIIGQQGELYDNLVEFLKLKKQKNINLIVLKAGDNLKLDNKTKIEVLFPNPTHEILENKINNNSLVFKLYYNNFSILFTGDIEEEAEKTLVDLYGLKLKSDILKVAHHGSKTSSTEELINFVKPKIALIGVGENNTFGHPNGIVLERLKSVNSKIFRTDKDGEIKIFVNKLGKITKIQKYINAE